MTDTAELTQYELPPGAVLAEQSLETGQAACKMLMGFIEGSKLKPVKIGKSEHIRIEHWAFLGKYFGITAEVVDVQPYGTERERGFIAKAILLNADQRKIGGAFAMCTDDEQNWKTRDTHAIFSMAQTRACSKAFATCLRWIPVLAGMSGTPLEEMPYDRPPQQQSPPPRNARPPVKPRGRPPVKPAAAPPVTHVADGAQQTPARRDDYRTNEVDEQDHPFGDAEADAVLGDDNGGPEINDGIGDWRDGWEPSEKEKKYKPKQNVKDKVSEGQAKRLSAGLANAFKGDDGKADWAAVTNYIRTRYGVERTGELGKGDAWALSCGLESNSHFNRR